MTDWGAHHFDIAQWGLGMDQLGPIEIVPPENFKAGHGVKFLYDNGAELIHGGRGGITFFGTEGEIYVDRGKLESKPDTIIKQTIADNEVHLYKSPGDGHGGHRQDWVNCLRSRQQPNCPIEVGARPSPSAIWVILPTRTARNWAASHSNGIRRKGEFVDNDAANKSGTIPIPAAPVTNCRRSERPSELESIAQTRLTEGRTSRLSAALPQCQLRTL